MKAVVGNRAYDIVEHRVKALAPVIEDGKPVVDDKGKVKMEKQVVVHRQLVSPERQEQRRFEKENSISSSRQRRRHKTHRFRVRRGVEVEA